MSGTVLSCGANLGLQRVEPGTRRHVHPRERDRATKPLGHDYPIARLIVSPRCGTKNRVARYGLLQTVTASSNSPKMASENPSWSVSCSLQRLGEEARHHHPEDRSTGKTFIGNAVGRGDLSFVGVVQAAVATLAAVWGGWKLGWLYAAAAYAVVLFLASRINTLLADAEYRRSQSRSR